MQSYTPLGGRHQIISVEKCNLMVQNSTKYTHITSEFAMLTTNSVDIFSKVFL